jgi:nitrate/nitrite-specific signal transduction histidine kinase
LDPSWDFSLISTGLYKFYEREWFNVDGIIEAMESEVATVMKSQHAFQEPLIQRLIFLFLILGLMPSLLLAGAPTIYISLRGTEALGESLLIMWGAQGISFLIIVLIGAGVTLRRLAIPIQELANGATAIAHGDLSYRVPIRSGDQELVALSRNFNAMADAVETMRNDIEQQRSALQEALDEREREFDAILKIANLVNTQADLHSTAERALDIVQAVLGTDTISLVLLDETGQITSTVCSCITCPYAPADRCEQCPRQPLVRQCFHAMQDTLFRRAIEQQEKIHVQDAQASDAGLTPNVVDALNQLGIRKFAIKPLITRGRVLGVLILMRPELKEIPVRAMTLVEALAENIAVLIENRHLQNKSRSLTIMEERRRLASELHDSVTQSLFTLSLTARGLKAALSGIPGESQQALDVLVEQTRVVQAEMRTLINELRPIDLDAGDLENALRQHIQSLRRCINTEVRLAIRGNVRGLPQTVQQNLNRIAQEALSNIARHANATCAEITIDISAGTATLTIRDNGTGFDPRAVALKQTGSLGLISMRERAEMLGGALLIRSQPADGTSITAHIPLVSESITIDVSP